MPAEVTKGSVLEKDGRDRWWRSARRDFLFSLSVGHRHHSLAMTDLQRRRANAMPVGQPGEAGKEKQETTTRTKMVRKRLGLRASHSHCVQSHRLFPCRTRKTRRGEKRRGGGDGGTGGEPMMALLLFLLVPLAAVAARMMENWTTTTYKRKKAKEGNRR